MWWGRSVTRLARSGECFAEGIEVSDQWGATESRLALASKGALRVELRAKGKMAHSAYPELGESAIDKLMAALHDVQAMPLPVEPEIGPSTLNIGLIEGGRAPNVIADKAEAHLLVRLVGPAEETEAGHYRTVGNRADVSFSLELPFVRMRKVGNLPTMVAKFTTDIPSLTAWGEPFLLGPGSIHVAHTPDEKIGKKELLDAVDLYVTWRRTLLRGNGSAASCGQAQVASWRRSLRGCIGTCFPQCVSAAEA